MANTHYSAYEECADCFRAVHQGIPGLTDRQLSDWVHEHDRWKRDRNKKLSAELIGWERWVHMAQDAHRRDLVSKGWASIQLDTSHHLGDGWAWSGSAVKADAAVVFVVSSYGLQDTRYGGQEVLAHVAQRWRVPKQQIVQITFAQLKDIFAQDKVSPSAARRTAAKVVRASWKGVVGVLALAEAVEIVYTLVTALAEHHLI